VLGTLLHFLFDLTGCSVVAALVSAVNESIWEHMKLIYYPMLLFAFVEYRVWGKEVPGFWCVKLKGILLALALIPALYYLYTGALALSADWFNITIFFIAAAVSFYLETRLFRRNLLAALPGWPALGLLCLMSLLFTWLTFSPPQIPLFQDPLTGTYGFIF
jgi:hypothetical protein